MSKTSKKVLYIATKESDYLQDLTYFGLCQVLGQSNVIDFHWNSKFHIPRKMYPRNLGYACLGFDLSNYKKIKQQIFRSPDWSEISCVFVAAAKPDCIALYLKIFKDIPASTPVVFIDGGDFSAIGGDLLRLNCGDLLDSLKKARSFDFIFKREMLCDQKYANNVAALPFSIRFDQMPVSKYEYKYDVSFWAVESDPIRTKALAMLENKFDCRENLTIRNQQFKKYARKGKFYLEEIKRCKVVLNFRGVGWDTLRYWEVFGLSTFLISQKPNIVIPDEFIAEKELIYCKDDLSDLIELCEYYLKDTAAREKIANAGFLKAKKSHSTEARCKYLLKTLRSSLGLKLTE